MFDVAKIRIFSVSSNFFWNFLSFSNIILYLCSRRLGNKNSELFQKKARLEISGIMQGDDTGMWNRYNAKVMQTEQSDYTSLPAYISIIEFSRPKAIFKKK